jgi:uncharacterized protein (TIGR02118 family)
MIRFLVTYEVPADPAEFERHYFEVHVPLTKQLPKLRRYEIGRRMSPVRGEPYYLVGQLEWDSMDDLKAAFASPEGRRTAEDLSQFAPTGVRSVIYEVESLYEA